MQRAYKYLITNFKEGSLSLATTHAGIRLLQGLLVSAVSEAGIREVKWKITPLSILGELMNDIESDEVSRMSEWLGVIDKETSEAIISTLYWDSEVTITKGESL